MDAVGIPGFFSAGITTSRSSRSYEDALEALNSLQSNKDVQLRMAENRDLFHKQSLGFMQEQLVRAGMKVGDIDSLMVVHVSGSKGKGSVCAMVESILRQYGLKTGFYSSPDLVDVRERIRINGVPISKELFSKYFWEVWNRIEKSYEFEGTKTTETRLGYFMFLTLLGYHAFLAEKVDVAVIETGIGGRYDCTNIVIRPIVCGITHLCLEHQNILGSTIASIADHKAGIMKPHCPVFTRPQQEEAMAVLKENADRLAVQLTLAPPWQSYNEPASNIGLEGTHQLTNASLAIQMSKSWLERVRPDLLEGCELGITTSQVPPLFVRGLKEVRWPGRCQVVERDGLTYFLDGAHTVDSIELCLTWYLDRITCLFPTGHPVHKVLVFNCTGDRSPAVLLAALVKGGFDTVIFCPHMPRSSLNTSSDSKGLTVMESCHHNYQVWLRLSSAQKQQDSFLVMSSLDQALSHISGLKSLASLERVSKLDVAILVTGSLYLVGSCLQALRYEI